MSFEYGFYEKEVSVLFVKHEKGELSFSELKKKNFRCSKRRRRSI